LKDFAAKELGKRSISTKQFIQYFIDPRSQHLDKKRVLEALNTIKNTMPRNSEKKSKNPSERAQRKITYQIVINQLITDQLNLSNEAETKKLYHKIKKNALDLAEWQADGQFIINNQKLEYKLANLDANLANYDESFVKNTDESTIAEGLLAYQGSFAAPSMNYQLLKDALWAHVFNLSNINATVSAASIQLKRKTDKIFPIGLVRRIMKQDLKPVLSASGKHLGYGIKRKIENGVVKFYGVVEETIIGDTLVLEIANGRGVILKEIWIYGESSRSYSSDDDNNLNYTNDVL